MSATQEALVLASHNLPSQDSARPSGRGVSEVKASTPVSLGTQLFFKSWWQAEWKEKRLWNITEMASDSCTASALLCDVGPVTSPCWVCFLICKGDGGGYPAVWHSAPGVLSKSQPLSFPFIHSGLPPYTRAGPLSLSPVATGAGVVLGYVCRGRGLFCAL